MESIAVAEAPAAAEGFPYLAVALTLLASAVLAWGTTEALKRTLLNRWKLHQTAEHLKTLGTESAIMRGFEASERGWWLPLMWFLAVLIGACVGCFAGGMSWDWHWGTLVGSIGGALSSFFVKLFKSRSKTIADAAVGKVLQAVGLPNKEAKG